MEYNSFWQSPLFIAIIGLFGTIIGYYFKLIVSHFKPYERDQKTFLKIEELILSPYDKSQSEEPIYNCFVSKDPFDYFRDKPNDYEIIPHAYHRILELALELTDSSIFFLNKKLNKKFSILQEILKEICWRWMGRDDEIYNIHNKSNTGCYCVGNMEKAHIFFKKFLEKYDDFMKTANKQFAKKL